MESRQLSCIPCTTFSTTCRNKIDNKFSAKRKNLKNKIIKDQRSIRDYLTQVEEISKQGDEIESGIYVYIITLTQSFS